MRQHGGMATSKSRFLRFSDFWPSECKFWWALFFVKSVSYQVTDTGLTVGTKNNRIKWVREFAKRISNSSKDLTMKILRNSVNRCKTV